MATTQNTYTGNNSTTDYSFTFPYVKEADVKVSLDTVDKTQDTDYTFANATTISFDTAPGTGVAIRIYRDTDTENAVTTFFAGSAIRAQDLNDNTNQVLYSAQERVNRDLDKTGDTMTGDLTMNDANVVFEGATADDHETTLTVTDPTADRTITLPNQSGTVPVLAASSNTQITATPEELNTLDGITSTVAELNIMDGVTATTAELNTMDGITATTAELNLMDGVTATTAELNLLDGVTATTTELNLVDGVTATTAELNTLDGVTSTAAELNLLDGVTSTTAELNILDGVTATAAEINILDGVTSTAAELNLLDGRSVSGATVSTDTATQENELPTTEAVVAYVTDQLDQVEGFVAIATETDFPNTQPPEGVAVSIGNVGGLSVDQNGQATNAARADGTAVTITGIEANFRPTSGTRDVDDGVRFIVTSSATANQYTYHKATLKESDLINLSNDINDFSNRYRVSGTEPDTDEDNGDLWWDTANNQLNAYNGTAWAPVTASGEFIRLLLRDTDGTAPTFDGSVRDYNLVREDDTSVAGSITTAQQLLLSVDGVMQRPNPGTTIATTGNGFCRVDADTIQLAGAPEAGAEVFAIQMGTATEINTPAEDSVDSQHYVDDSIDSQHLNSGAGVQAVTSDVIRDDAVTDDKLADSTDTDADRAVGTNHIKDANVTQAKIADEAIDEARLQVSNAPTDGRFLQAQSGNTGGLTWAEVPAPATADTDLFDADGTTTDFTIEAGRTVHNILVFVNGLVMRPTFGGTTRDYTVNGNQLEFETAPADGDEIDVRYLPA